MNSDSSYICHVPTTETNITVPAPATPHLKEKGLSLVQETFGDGNCFFAFNIQAGYWTVGYCFGDKVIQFHEEDEDFFSGNHKPQIPDHVYVLGKFPNVPPYKKVMIKNQMKQKVVLDSNDYSIFDGEFSYFEDNQKYLKHTLAGEICDLTLKPRTIDIVYKCDENVGLLEFQEIKTCQYQMVIGVPRLCEIEDFRKAEEDVVDVNCKAIEGSFEKLDLNKYQLQPLGGGLYIGQKSPYPNIAVSINELNITSFGESFFSSLEKIPSPDSMSLKWTDSFIYWINLYDMFGNHQGLFRIERDGSLSNHQIGIEKVEGDKVQANFEYFMR
ncbi:YOS9 [Candida oxycetoniae]|uniref:Endoplasmic reticulum lectin n=1 Tax=Candida oxycetoniae TaxID=497107 RepID=A0AAI9X000_9ASCO|nr:YOS9 [Candida oxycetoniae]KAI3406956.2 YOS9 [Candida oxycetoniae]